MRTLLLSIVLLASAAPAFAQDAVVDTHVHLHKGESSVAEYRAQLKASGQSVDAFGAMWFGGPNQALAGNPADIRKRNDELIALAAKNPDMIAIATVHPYDGDAALAEVDRVAARGVKLLKIHPHTQKFDAADPRVLTLVKRAGDRDHAGMSGRERDQRIVAPDDVARIARERLIRAAEPHRAERVHRLVRGLELRLIFVDRRLAVPQVDVGVDDPVLRGGGRERGQQGNRQ